MPSEDRDSEQDLGRLYTAVIFDSAADIATRYSRVVSDPGVAAALNIGAGIASVVATLVRVLGTDGAKEAIAELAARKYEGVITDAHVARDNKTIADAVADLYRVPPGDTDRDEQAD